MSNYTDNYKMKMQYVIEILQYTWNRNMHVQKWEDENCSESRGLTVMRAFVSTRINL